MRDFSMLIDGRAVAGAATMEVINPATEEVIAACPRADAAQLEAAVAAARRAFPGWRDTPHATRVAALLALAERIEHHADEIARLLTLEQGKPLAAARMEVSFAPLMIPTSPASISAPRWWKTRTPSASRCTAAHSAS